MRSVLNKMREAVDKKAEAGRLVPETVRIPLLISQEQLNQLAAKGLGEDKRIRNLQIDCVQDVLVISGSVAVGVFPLSFSTRVAIEHCELGTRKRLVLRRLDSLDLSGDNLLASLFARVVKVVVCGMLGIDIGAMTLRGVEGLTVDKDRITADLDVMGAGEAIKTAILAKLSGALNVGPLKALVVTKLLDVAYDKILANLTVLNVVISEKGISGELEINLSWFKI